MLGKDIARRANLPEDSPLVDNTVQQGYSRETAVFQVPSDTADELVQFQADKYRRKFGNDLERRGFQVLAMSIPVVDKRPHVHTDPDRRQYAILAICKRRPVTYKLDVPDLAVPELLRLGAKLA